MREMSLSLEAAAGWVPERVCGQCLWIRDYCRRYICFIYGEAGRTVTADEDATWCDDYEEALR